MRTSSPSSRSSTRSQRPPAPIGSNTGWDTYPIMSFPEIPPVEVDVIDRPELPPLGAGEATQGPTAAAIANAVHAAIGARVRDLPITPERIRIAVAAL